MPIVTLTTDFGVQDHYTAVLKGTLLRTASELTLVDISHNIKNYDIVQASFIFRNAWQAFPHGTIHLLIINDLSEDQLDYLITAHKRHFFIGPDNGIFSLIFDQPPGPYYRLPAIQSPIELNTILAQAVVQLKAGKAPEKIGRIADQITERLSFQPVVTADQIRGTVIYIDKYQNAIINIQKSLFDQIGKDRPFTVRFKRHQPITRLSRYYYDVPVGEPLCWFNPGGYLEIAINMGEAAGLLGLHLEDMIQIDFYSENTSSK